MKSEAISELQFSFTFLLESVAQSFCVERNALFSLMRDVGKLVVTGD